MADKYRVRAMGEVLPIAETDITFFDVEVNWSSTQVDGWGVGDVINVIGPFPEGAKVALDYSDEGGGVPEAGTTEWEYDFSDGDTNATPTLDFDIGFADDDEGTNIDQFINESQAPQTGAADYHDATENGTDIGGKYLVLVVTGAAATAAALTLRVRGAYRIPPRRQYIDATSAQAVAI